MKLRVLIADPDPDLQRTITAALSQERDMEAAGFSSGGTETLSQIQSLRPDVVLLLPPPGDASFPSGHTAASFAAVFALKASGSPLWKPALLWALLIAFSRLYLYVHWPSDVLGGAVLGAVVGWLGAKLAAAAADRISPEAK